MAFMATACLVDAQTVGPMVGQVSTTDARFLYRSDGASQNLKLSVLAIPGGEVVAADTVTSEAANDYVAKFHVTGLEPGTQYSYKLEEVGGSLIAGMDGDHYFSTCLTPGSRGSVTAAFISGANATAIPLFRKIDELDIDQFYLGGDTPYIDSRQLSVMRQKRRDFLNLAGLSTLMRHMPLVNTWDDHDFGLNNSNGATFSDKDKSLQAFTEYTAHDQYGTGSEGVYYKVDHGMMEVFMLDPRWFSQTEPSPVDPSQKTSLGPEQWAWLLDGLTNSTAHFKVLAMGQIWQDKKNGETDDMFTYYYERDALLDFIRDQGIPGVVMLGGDIHVSRYLVHANRVGYDMHDFITSPAHNGTIASLNVYHPDLEWSSIQPHQFLTLTASTLSRPPTLTAKYYLADGTIQHEVTIPYDEVVPQLATGLGDELRAWWSFEGGYTNQSVLGIRLNIGRENGASLVADGGLSGGAVSLVRASNQYLVVPRSVLHDNSSEFTASMWCKAATLPGGSERYFLMESTGQNVADTADYAISLGLREGSSADKVNLQIYTRTLRPATGVSTAPTENAESFDTDVDRSVFSNQWTHVAYTYDSEKFLLYVNGAQVAEHTMTTPGPLSENGGLVIGGHRAGTGRNFDGLVDEVALWTRVLSAAEIAVLYNGGTPPVLPVATTIADTDGDSMPDWWEELEGLDPEQPADAMADDDGDGIPAHLEREIWTSPSVDDSDLFNALRDIVRPDSTNSPLIYRDVSLDTLNFLLHLDTSSNLADWTRKSFGAPGVSATAEGSYLRIEVPVEGSNAHFYRFVGEAP